MNRIYLFVFLIWSRQCSHGYAVGLVDNIGLVSLDN